MRFACSVSWLANCASLFLLIAVASGADLPYRDDPKIVAAADRIVVTPDSVNMLSEASATGRPVFSLLPDSARGKLTGLHAELRAQGWLHPLDAAVDVSGLAQPPLRELAAVASKVWHVLESTRPDVVAALTGD